MEKTAAKLYHYLEYLKDPIHVWRFQEYFGVSKEKLVENQKNGKFVAKNIDDIYYKNKVTKIDSKIVSSDEDYLSSSGSDESGKANVIYYKIHNWFWYYLFFLGTQLGDETYYSIFFCFWFWNIDGAVGRRVILVWNLVMYIGTTILIMMTFHKFREMTTNTG